MMSSSEYIASFSPHLFWDIDKKQFNMTNCPSQIIQRVLEYGNLNDWALTLSCYGLEKIVSEVKQLRSLDPKALSFICCISDTKKEDYRCYHFQQSNPALWEY